MPKDVRISGLQVNKIIASGSTGTNAQLMIYGIEAEDSSQPNQGIIDPTKFGTGSIGTDVFLFVSGGSGDQITSFGGDVHISGALTVDGTVIVPDVNNYLFSVTDGLMEQSGSLALSGSGLFFGGLSGSHTALSDGSPAFDTINGLSISTGSFGQVVISGNPMSASIATDINSLSFIKNVIDNSGDRTLSDQDSGRVIFMNGSSTNLVKIPPTLSDGFNVILVQSSSIQVVVQSTASLKYPSITFNSASAEQNSILFVYSGSSGIFLGGDMELK